MDNHNEHEELKRSAPVLSGLPKVDPFVVPDGFFERFPHEMQALVVAHSKPVPAWNWWKRMAIALPVLALLGTAVWWMRHETQIPPALAAVDVTPLSNEELDQMDDADLLAFVEDAPATDGSQLGTVDMQLNEEELVAYLDNEHADLTDLITDTE